MQARTHDGWKRTDTDGLLTCVCGKTCGRAEEDGHCQWRAWPAAEEIEQPSQLLSGRDIIFLAATAVGLVSILAVCFVGLMWIRWG